jgi:hypothetical protein
MKDGEKYNNILNYEVAQLDYEVTTRSCEHQIKDF